MPENLVLVTGASRGLGAALAGEVPFPARVVGVSRSAQPGSEDLRADLSTPEGWERTAAWLERELPRHAGARCVLVHNAGTLLPMGFAGETEPAAYREAVLLNSASTQVLGDAYLRAAARTDAEHWIVMISSGAASKAYEGWSHYCAGKAAMDHWVRAAAVEQALRGDRVRLLAVAPGIVDTDMQAQIRATAERDFPQRARFVDYHEQGELRAPVTAAREIWSLLDRELPNGAVIDLRDLLD